MQWSIYILLCSDNSYYIGASTDVKARFATHAQGKGGRYTRSHTPVKIIYEQVVGTKSQALKLEAALKKRTKKQKTEYMNAHT